jgi:hypothetical protein
LTNETSKMAFEEKLSTSAAANGEILFFLEG